MFYEAVSQHTTDVYDAVTGCEFKGKFLIRLQLSDSVYYNIQDAYESGYDTRGPSNATKSIQTAIISPEGCGLFVIRRPGCLNSYAFVCHSGTLKANQYIHHHQMFRIPPNSAILIFSWPVNTYRSSNLISGM